MKKKTLVLLVTVILAAAVCAGLALLLRQEPESRRADAFEPQ